MLTVSSLLFPQLITWETVPVTRRSHIIPVSMSTIQHRHCKFHVHQMDKSHSLAYVSDLKYDAKRLGNWYVKQHRNISHWFAELCTARTNPKNCTIIHCDSKTSQHTFDHNFAECWPLSTFLTGKLNRKFALNSSLFNVQSHHKCVSTLPCEIPVFKQLPCIKHWVKLTAM